MWDMVIVLLSIKFKTQPQVTVCCPSNIALVAAIQPLALWRQVRLQWEMAQTFRKCPILVDLARNARNRLISPYPLFVVVALLLLVSAWSFLLTMDVPGPCSTLSACLRSVQAPTSHTAPPTPLKTTVGKWAWSKAQLKDWVHGVKFLKKK